MRATTPPPALSPLLSGDNSGDNGGVACVGGVVVVVLKVKSYNSQKERITLFSFHSNPSKHPQSDTDTVKLHPGLDCFL